MTDDKTTESKSELRELQLKAVLHEYDDLRDEIKRRIDQRTHISYFAVFLMLGTLGLYFTSKNPLILVFVPLILIYWLFMIDSSYSTHLDIVWYIREKIEGLKLPLLIGRVDGEEGWIYWETNYFKDNEKRYSQRFKIYIIFSGIIYVICGLMIYKNLERTLFWMYWIVYGVLLLYFSRKCWRYYAKYSPQR